MEFTTAIFALGLIVSVAFFHGGANAAEASKSQTLTKAGTEASIKGPDSFFTGSVRIDPLFRAKHPDAPFTGGHVSFEPGARSFWHMAYAPDRAAFADHFRRGQNRRMAGKG